MLERRFVQRVDIVAYAIALTFVGGARVGRGEIYGGAVRRPRRWNAGADVCRVVCQRPRLAAAGGQQVQLAVAPEDERAAVRRPAGCPRRFARFAKGELFRCAADGLPPQVPHRTACFPIGVTAHVGERAAVGRQLRIEEALQLGEIDKRHRTAGVRLAGNGGRDGQDRQDRQDGSACGHASPRPGNAAAKRRRQFALGAGPQRRCRKDGQDRRDRQDRRDG